MKVVERRAKALQELGRERGEDVKLLRKLLHEVNQLASFHISIQFNPSSTPPLLPPQGQVPLDKTASLEASLVELEVEGGGHVDLAGYVGGQGQGLADCVKVTAWRRHRMCTGV